MVAATMRLAPVLALLALTACENRTYVVVTVDIDPALTGTVTQARFRSDLLIGDTVVSSDSRNIPENASSDPMTFPDSFVIVADGRGKNGETIEVTVEGVDASGTIRARARGVAPIVPGKESSLPLTLRSPCTDTDECLVGGMFCDNPITCDCEGPNCLEGFCNPFEEDDSPCTEVECNEAARLVNEVPVADGTACGDSDDGLPVSCVSGVCGCGDGDTTPDIEQCDEGEDNANAPNRCRLEPACSLPFCGDGIVDDRGPFFEECDNGPDNDDAMPNACRTNCKLPSCGDFVTDTDEECDDGFQNDNEAPLACRTNCAMPSCGDGVTDIGTYKGVVYEEECDLGAANSNTAVDGCRESVTLENGTGPTVACKVAFCGDEVVDTGERCDDNNTVNGDGCNPTCTLFGEVTLVAGSPGGPGNADGVGDSARLHDVQGITMSGGFAYVVSSESHASAFDHSVRRIALATGAVTTIAGVAAEAGDSGGAGIDARFSQPRDLVTVGSDLYILDTGNNKLKRLDLTTNDVTSLAGTGTLASVDGPFASAQFAAPSFVAARTSTELLEMDTNPSTGCLLRRIDLAGEAVSFVAGTSGLCFAFALDGTGASARFGAVGGMAMGPEPFLYITDTFKIRRVNVDTGLVETIAGSSEGFANGIGTAAQFATLGEIAVGPSNDLYIADRGNSMIRRLDLATNDVTTVTVTGGIEFPRALAITGSTIAVAEQPAHTLRVGDVSTTPLSLPVVAGASGARGTSDGSGVSALLDRPVGLGVGTGASSLELLYVAEQQTGLTRVIDLGVPANTVSTFPISGTRASGIASSGGRLYVTMEQSGQRLLQEINPTTGAGISAAVITATAARGVAVVGGHAYVATANEATIRRIDIDPALGSDELFAGQTNQRATGDGDVNSARFGDPTQIVACGGDLYISDSTDLFIANIIRKIDLDTTIVSTVAGAPTAVGAEDGIGAAARFNTPEGIACDGTSLYVADSKNHIVRQIELATNRVTTLAGIPHRSGAIDGVGTDARFNEPFGLTYDPTTGDLFVTDASEHVVRRIH